MEELERKLKIMRQYEINLEKEDIINNMNEELLHNIKNQIDRQSTGAKDNHSQREILKNFRVEEEITYSDI